MSRDVEPKDFLVPSLISLFCCTALCILLFSGYLKTFLNKWLVLERGIYLSATSLYFLIISFILKEDEEGSCKLLGPILCFFLLSSQVSFGMLMIDILEVFREPFRTQKFQTYRYAVPPMAATIMSLFFAGFSSKIIYRTDLGVCWIPQEEGDFKKDLNAWNWITLYIPIGTIYFFSVIVVLYIFVSMEIWKPFTWSDWELRRFLDHHIYFLLELVVYCLVSFIYWIIVGIFYMEAASGSQNNEKFIFLFALQGTIEASIVVFVNFIRFAFSYIDVSARRASESISAAPSTGYESLGDVQDQYLAFEPFIRKRLLEELELFIVNGEVQKEWRQCMKIKSHKAEDFARIRELSEVQDFHTSFKNITRKVKIEAGGASGAIFANTHDGKYRLKQLDGAEGPAMKELVSDLRKEWEQRRFSLICRVFALYSVKIMGCEVWFLIMQDAYCHMGNPDEIYDMKGSTYKREVGKNPLDEVVLKDLDFRLPVLLDDITNETFVDNLKQDCHFLAQRQLMDYSLLVGIKYRILDISQIIAEEDEHLDLELNMLQVTAGSVRCVEHYSFSIIDFLQEFNWRKKGEIFYKTRCLCVPKNKVSGIEPDAYKDRFIKNVLRRLFDPDTLQKTTSAKNILDLFRGPSRKKERISELSV